MTLAATSFLSVQYEDQAGYWIKFYEQGTTTPKSMATDISGGTLLAKAEISQGGTVPAGFIKTVGDQLFIPFVDGAYDCWAFPTEAEADANDTTNAIQLADDITAVSGDDELADLFIEDFIPFGVDPTTEDISTYVNEAFDAAVADNMRVTSNLPIIRISNPIIIKTHCDLERTEFQWDGGVAGHLGTHTGGSSATVLTDSNANFPTFSAGRTILNRQDGGRGEVIANTSTTITVAELIDGTLNTWELGDGYVLRDEFQNERAIIIASGTDNSLWKDPTEAGKTPGAVYPDDFVIEKTIKLGTLLNLDHVAGDGWANQGIGMRISTVLSSNVSWKAVEGFTQGVLAGGTNDGLAHCKLFPGEILNCLELLVEAPMYNGWANQNVWDGGRYVNFSGEFYADDLIDFGTVIHKQEETNHLVNGNVYINTSMEGSRDESKIDSGGTQNLWLNPRMENSGSLRGDLLARNDKRLEFSPQTVGIAGTYRVTIQPIGGVNTDVEFVAGVGDTILEISEGLVAAFNVIPTLVAIGQGSVLNNNKFVVTARVDNVGFTYVPFIDSNTGSTDNPNEPIFFNIVSHTWAVGSGNIVGAARITFRGVKAGSGDRNEVREITNLFFEFGDTVSVDDPARVVHIGTADNNIVNAANTNYEEDSATKNEGFKRYRNSSSNTATHSWYETQADLYANADLFTAACGANGFGTKSTNTALDLELMLEGKSLRMNHYQFNDGIDDTSANLGMVRIADIFPGGIVVGSGVYNNKAVYGDVIIDSGAHDAADSTTVMTDSTQAFTVDDLINYAIVNTTDNSIGNVISNTVDSVTVKQLVGGTDDTWQSGDSFQIRPHQGIGQHDAATSATILTNTLAKFEINRYVGYVIFNITDGSSGTVTETSEITITVGALTGGSDNNWESGDAYMLQRTVLDKDNFNGWFWDDCLWNGSIHRFDTTRFWSDTEFNLRHKVSEPTYENDGFIVNRPRFDGGTNTSDFLITDGGAARVNATGGTILITMPTVQNTLTSQFFIRDESDVSTSTFSELVYDGTNNIMGVAANYPLDAANFTYEITFVGGTRGYHVTLA